jgi:hypothetical protein
MKTSEWWMLGLAFSIAVGLVFIAGRSYQAVAQPPTTAPLAAPAFARRPAPTPDIHSDTVVECKLVPMTGSPTASPARCCRSNEVTIKDKVEIARGPGKWTCQ